MNFIQDGGSFINLDKVVKIDIFSRPGTSMYYPQYTLAIVDNENKLVTITGDNYSSYDAAKHVVASFFTTK